MTKFDTAARYPRCVPGVNPRIVMSSVMRWRKVLMDFNHVIQNSSKHAYFRIHDPYTVTGYRITDSFWANSRFLYFALKFSEPMTSHMIVDRVRKLDYPNVPERASSNMITTFSFGSGEPLKARISISPVSIRCRPVSRTR